MSRGRHGPVRAAWMEQEETEEDGPRAGRQQAEGSAPGQCDMVDLSGKGLDRLPKHILQMASLQNLYLEGNAISGLSEDFFHQLPNLLWLDLRNNKLRSLPHSIGDHRCLKTLLLEGNPIRRLPVELGNLTSLKALNLRKCPIEFPPEVIMHQGLIVILAFLRQPLKRGAEHTATSAHNTEMPSIEKLQLNVRTGSSLSFSDEKEQQRFKTLKQKLLQEEKKEDFSQSKKVWGAGFLSSISNIPRQKTPNLNILFPELTAYDVTIQTKRKRELRLAAMKEHKEKQAFIEQRMKDQKALREWRDQAKLMQEQKEIEIKQRPITERNKIVKSAPYATDPNYYQSVRSGDLKGPQTCEPTQRLYSRNEMEEAKAAKDQELRERIQQHIKLLRERRKRQKGSLQEELATAKADLEIATELKSTLARRKIIGNLS